MIITHDRRATTDEIVAEMDRRGLVIEVLEAERDRYLEALRSNIDSVGVGFGYFEDAARAMQEMARKALFCKEPVSMTQGLR